MFRKCLFWTHLVCGVLAGIVVFTMSITGVVLTYERQIEHWVASLDYVPAEAREVRLPLEQLLLVQRTAAPDIKASTMSISRDPGAPVEFRAGRSGGISINPWTAKEFQGGSTALGNFFGVITRFHRWFNVEGENRALARQITGVANVIFLFLVLSGMYLWLPGIWKAAVLKSRLWFRGSYPDSKARDYSWHHIFGIWMAIPLLAVVYTGAVISYPWAANLMYSAFGAEVPVVQAGGPGGPGALAAAAPVQARSAGGAGASSSSARHSKHGEHQEQAATEHFLAMEKLIEAALTHSGEGWQRLNITLPAPADPRVRIEIDKGNGAQAHKRHTLALDRSTAEVLSVTEFSDTPLTQQLRGIARFLHTGEVLGFWGQTIAGLASFAALFLVWTGFALSWRRLIAPLYSRAHEG